MSSTVTLPWPKPNLWRNAQSGKPWWFRHKAAKAGRKLAYEHSLEQNVRRFRDAKELKVHLSFIQPDHIRRDEDNTESACKSYLDGIADWIGVDDSAFRLTRSFDGFEKPGSVTVTIEEIA